jgi:hypothetical protein
MMIIDEVFEKMKSISKPQKKFMADAFKTAKVNPIVKTRNA